MGIPIFENLITLGGIDVIAIYTQNDTEPVQVFSAARPIRASIKEDSKTMDHPLETGSTITDYIIFNPIEIDMSMIIQGENYQNTYCSIRQFFTEATLFTIQTKTGLYSDMIISSMPHQENNEYWDAIPIELKFKQVVFASNSTASFSPEAANDSGTAKRGNLQPKAPSPTQLPNRSAFKHIFQRN